MNHSYHNKLQRNIGLDYINTFITNLNMQSSIWVLYLAFCELNLTQVGLLEGIYHATSIICEIPSGAVADLLGRKKSMIVSRICVAASCVIMLFSKSFWWFALSFIVQALGNNFNSGSEEALVYDSMKCLGQEEKYMGVCGKLNMLIEISQALATVAGGVLAEYSYFWCYVACVVIAILTLIPVVLMVEPPITKNNAEQGADRNSTIHQTEFALEDTYSKKPQHGILETTRTHFKNSFEILKGDERIFKVIAYYSVIFASYTLLFFYSQQYYFDFGYNKIKISIIFLFAGVMSCLGAAASEKLYHCFGKKIAIIAAGLIAVCYVGYGFEKPLVAIGTFLIAGFCNAVLYPVQSDTLNGLIPSEQRATLISVNSMFFSVAMIITFPVVGAMSDRWGLKQIIRILGIVLLIFLLIWNVVESRRRND